MAAPTIRGQTAPVAGGATTSPAGTEIGDLVLVFTFERLGAGTASTLTVDTGNSYVEIRNHFHDDGTTDGALAVGYKIATANGAQSYQAFTSSTGTPEWWTGCSVLTKNTFDVSTLPPSTSSTQTTNAAPNPPDLTGLSSGTEYLAMAIAAWRFSSALTNTAGVPSGWGDMVEVAGSATADLAISSLAISGVTSINPPAYTDDQAPTGSATITLAVAALVLDVLMGRQQF